jgi:hypothetical protein
MTRNLKALGLALVAVFAVSAMTASAASATDLFTVGNGKSALMTGISHTSEFKITPNGPSFNCTTARYAATAVHKASEATVDTLYEGKVNATPHNAECSASVGSITAVDMNGCDYDLTGNTNAEDPPVVGKDATIHVTCPVGKVIQITSSLGAVISIPAQTPTLLGGVHYTNLPNHTGGPSVTVKATVTGITFTCAPAFACGLGGIPTHGNNSDYTDDAIVTGYEDLNSAGSPITPANEGTPATRTSIEVSTGP